MNQARGQKALAGQLSYRVATVDDAALLQRMIQDSFRHPDGWTGAASGIMSRYSISLERVIEKISKLGSTFIIVAEAGDGGAPAVACFQVYQKSATLIRFATFAVDVQHQGRGLARAVMQLAEDYCRQVLGATTMQLNTLSSRPGLLAWYRQRCGYHETGVREPFSVTASFGGGGGGAASGGEAVPDDLCFIVMEKELQAAGR
ncbi:hypothetical protein LMH87_004211 [Akanthomyces muscarius]|uniref:N-acetyltransferase domain-containing protein n=1 Tax=Akanthomyces muscarius TaxID=2231603 RepID=A0A9W8Q2V7_AKAMU|nr:hypothetical protein LMH87_004211 [Akanthomyces muscarius]KAJ4145358.1 hypothetical protein LMH87_004211 [Akanthomyces muscarius]